MKEFIGTIKLKSTVDLTLDEAETLVMNLLKKTYIEGMIDLRENKVIVSDKSSPRLRNEPRVTGNEDSLRAKEKEK